MPSCAGCIDRLAATSLTRRGAVRHLCVTCARKVLEWEHANGAVVGEHCRSKPPNVRRVQRELCWPRLIESVESTTTFVCPGRKKPMPDMEALDTWAADRKWWPHA